MKNLFALIVLGLLFPSMASALSPGRVVIIGPVKSVDVLQQKIGKANMTQGDIMLVDAVYSGYVCDYSQSINYQSKESYNQSVFCSYIGYMRERVSP